LFSDKDVEEVENLPLLRLVTKTSATEKDLATKAGGILRNKLSHVKEVPSQADVPTADFGELASSVRIRKREHALHVLVNSGVAARRACEWTSSSSSLIRPTPELTNTCSACSLFLIRTLDASSPKSAVGVDTYRGKARAGYRLTNSAIKGTRTRVRFRVIKSAPLCESPLSPSLSSDTLPGPSLSRPTSPGTSVARRSSKRSSVRRPSPSSRHSRSNSDRLRRPRQTPRLGPWVRPRQSVGVAARMPRGWRWPAYA
jgi:hypothetical protein